jgi:hypothetical protein
VQRRQLGGMGRRWWRVRREDELEETSREFGELENGERGSWAGSGSKEMGLEFPVGCITWED